MEDALAKVRARFVTMLNDRADTLKQVHSAMAGDDLSSKDRDALRFISHKLSGTAATLGFDALGDLARTVERMVSDTSDAVETEDLRDAVWELHAEAVWIMVTHGPRALAVGEGLRP